MKTMTAKIEDSVDELLIVLERDIQHIEKSLLRLNELRSLVIKHDDASLDELLGIIRAESDSYKSNELKRQEIRKDLAVSLDCDMKQMTLSRLEAELTGEKKVQIAEIKSTLSSLAGQLKKEYMSTTMLLSDCSRFNSLLLNSIFELGRPAAITYCSDGSKKRRTDPAFLNLQS